MLSKNVPKPDFSSVMCPALPERIARAKLWKELNENLREVIEMLLGDGEPKIEADFIGTQTVMVA